ncbi:MAG: YkgJ family cysteine cluster protein [Verrucomicrobia bacterium]|nr:YkgJ family cysteine cluster protein [Verrucomicrobiota bacterium]
MTADAISQQLCVTCGLCCNGVIFRDVELRASDDLARLKTLGLPIKKTGKKIRFAQPCAALECSLCKIYAERPSYCREFECVLLRSTIEGNTEPAAALRIIRTTQKRAAKVIRLLRELGDENEHLSLSKRFKQVTKQFDTGHLTGESAGVYGDLTIAVHELNLILSSAFYPGSES